MRPLTDAILAGQQATADRFHRIGLIPRAITVRDAVVDGAAGVRPPRTEWRGNAPHTLQV